jgi:hypothetical protein
MKATVIAWARASARVVQEYWVASALCLLLFTSVFQAAVVFSVFAGHGFLFGVAPYWFVGAFLFFAVVIQSPSAARTLTAIRPKDARLATLCLSAFAVYAIASAFTLPWIFEGIKVLSPRSGLDIQYLNPSTLRWSLSNAGQAGYMLMNFAVFLFLVLRVHGDRDHAFTHLLLLGIGLWLIGFALFQHISVLYFPNDAYNALYTLSHNNPVSTSYPVTTARTNSFFLEPSFFGGFAAALAILGMNVHMYSGRTLPLLLALAGGYAVLTSVSATGYVAFVAGVLVTGAFVVIRLLRTRASPPDRQAARRFPVVLVLLLCVGLLFWQEQTRLDQAELVRQQTLEKQNTGSFRVRLWADQFSLSTVSEETYFLGAGLGSNRPSSFLAYLVSNMGLPGLISFLGFVFFLARACLRELDRLGPWALAVCAAFFTYLVAMFAALPDPSWPPYLWILAGLTVAELAPSQNNGATSSQARAPQPEVPTAGNSHNQQHLAA